MPFFRTIYVSFLFLTFSSFSKDFIKMGHRGACGYAPENTLASFAKAIECGCDMVELDVHMCKSGQVIVIHDKNLERTTNGSGLVGEKTLEQIKLLDAGDGQKIPTLAEVLGFVDKKVNVNIELKDPGAVGSVVMMIQDYVYEKGWSYKHFLVTAFDHYLLKEIADLDEQINIGLLLCSTPLVIDQMAASVGATIVVASESFVHQQFVNDVHDCGLDVFVYTVNESHEIVRTKQLDVDGIISDFPDRL